jgi:cyanophycinase
MPLTHDGARGHLVAIGGAEDKTSDMAILKRVMELAPPDNREVAVVATASGIPDEVLPAYEAAFRQIGAEELHLMDVQNRAAAADPENAARVKRSGVIFFTGGDQLRLTHVLGGSKLLEAVRQRYRDGAVVAGTSAGAVAMSKTMIYNGAAADALRKGAVKMTGGLGFVEGVVIDSHFLERGRFTRLMQVGASNPEYLGLGLGEDAGVIFHRGRVLEAIGGGHVILVDSRGLGGSNVADVDDGAPVAVEGVTMHALIAGYGYDLDRHRFLDAAAAAETIYGKVS